MIEWKNMRIILKFPKFCYSLFTAVYVWENIAQNPLEGLFVLSVFIVDCFSVFEHFQIILRILEETSNGSIHSLSISRKQIDWAVVGDGIYFGISEL